MSTNDGFADDIERENEEARLGMIELGAALALVIDDALAPGLEHQSVRSCLHILDEINKVKMIPIGHRVEAGPHQALLCPMHPKRLLCNLQHCIELHFHELHAGEFETAACFICEARMRDPLTGEARDDFTPITAQVKLRKQLPFYDDNRQRGRWFVYEGQLWTLPVAYLCPRHSEVVELPLRAEWPRNAGAATKLLG